MAAFIFIFLTYALWSWFLSDLIPLWYAPFLMAFIGGFIGLKSGWKAFLAGFIAVGLYTGLSAAYYESLAEGKLPAQIAEIMGLGSVTKLIALTVAIFGFTGGAFTITGYYLKTSFYGKPRRRR